MGKAKVGLLALYLKLYDDTQSWLRPEVEAFQKEIEERLGKNIEVVHHDICRIKPEIEKAIEHFEVEDVDAIVTLHLAYSPSLECYKALGKSKLPILVLDTTPDYSFNATSGSGRVMQNHGIHGVQDMCSLLRRTETPYQVFAGHYLHSDVLERIERAAKGAMMAHKMQHCRVGRVGDSFEGMGDFSVPDEALENMGISIASFDVDQGINRLTKVDPELIKKEWAEDRERFKVEDLSEKVYEDSARVGLALRSWIDEEKLDALTINFLATEANPALPLMPFLELCKCMERGIGYAGEGDVMNAAFVSALMQGFGCSTFAEMFCPDWQGESVFCSHMGEFNPAIAAEPILLTELDFTYTSAENPAVIYACMDECENAGFVNLNPIENGRYVLIVAPGKMLPVQQSTEEMERTVRGWFQPEVSVSAFLEEYSSFGGGHHGAIIYDLDIEALKSFACCMDWDFALINHS